MYKLQCCCYCLLLLLLRLALAIDDGDDNNDDGADDADEEEYVCVCVFVWATSKFCGRVSLLLLAAAVALCASQPFQHSLAPRCCGLRANMRSPLASRGTLYSTPQSIQSAHFHSTHQPNASDPNSRAQRAHSSRCGFFVCCLSKMCIADN